MSRCARKLLPLLVAFSSLLFAVSALADSSATARADLAWKVLPFQSLTLFGGGSSGTSTTSRFTLREPTESDLLLGYIEERGAMTLVASSNVAWSWSVKVRAVETNMGQSRDGTTVKPLSDFLLRANGGTYFSISAFDRTLASGAFGVQSLVVDYKVLTDRQSYKPGEYGLTLVYTITTEK